MPDIRNFESRFLLKHGILMIALGTAICALGSLMVKPADQPFGYVAGLALIVGYVLAAMLPHGFHKLRALSHRIALSYIAAGFALVCYVAFGALRTGSLDVRIIGLLTGLLGLFWSAWYLMLAFRFQRRALWAVGLTALAAVNSSLSFMLANLWSQNRLGVISLCGIFILVAGVQLYLVAMLLYREFMAEMPPVHS